MVTTAAELERLLPAVRCARWAGIDTEADSLHSYPEKLCLVQISLPTTEALVDPLAGFDLGPLWEALRDHEIILHGGDYDLRLLYRSQRFVPCRVFDTLTAARLLGHRQFGLHHLVKEYLGITLSKGAQKANWSRRPLTPRMIDYALADARYLRPLADCLRRRLEELGRLEWHAQMCEHLIRWNARDPEPSARPPWQIKGASRLDPRGLGVLREVWHWREQEARRANRPPFFILDHERLLNIAERAAQNNGFSDLIPRRYSPTRRRSLVQAVERALQLPESELPELHREPGLRMTERQKRRFQELQARRDAAAERLGLEASFIASKSALVALALDKPPEEWVLPWQAELLLSERPRGARRRRRAG